MFVCVLARCFLLICFVQFVLEFFDGLHQQLFVVASHYDSLQEVDGVGEGLPFHRWVKIHESPRRNGGQRASGCVQRLR